jgi:hypothetical protein
MRQNSFGKLWPVSALTLGGGGKALYPKFAVGGDAFGGPRSLDRNWADLRDSPAD